MEAGASGKYPGPITLCQSKGFRASLSQINFSHILTMTAEASGKAFLIINHCHFLFVKKTEASGKACVSCLSISVCESRDFWESLSNNFIPSIRDRASEKPLLNHYYDHDHLCPPPTHRYCCNKAARAKKRQANTSLWTLHHAGFMDSRAQSIQGSLSCPTIQACILGMSMLLSTGVKRKNRKEEKWINA